MLFGKKKKKTGPAPSCTISVPYSKTNKGYKRIRITKTSDPLVDIDVIRAMPDPDEIIFQEYLFPGTSPLLRVSADGVRLGTFWKNELDAEYYDMIRSGKCTAVSLGTNATDVYLFVKG